MSQQAQPLLSAVGVAILTRMGRGKARRGGKRQDGRAVERQQAYEDRAQMICEGKSGRYRTEAEARQSAGWVKSQNPGSHQMKVYHCDQCGMWHLTTRGM